MTGHPRSPVSFDRVDRRNSFHALATALRERILTGHLSPGEALPNERELGDQAGLSRGSVREALRMLERDGLVATRPGRNGGSTVRRPGRSEVSRTVEAFVRGQEIGLAAVLEVREAIEPALAALAARHRTDADLHALAQAGEHLVDCGSDSAAFVAANSRWHWVVAEASGNPLLIAIAASLWDLLYTGSDARVVSDPVRRAVLDAHAGIEDAIRDADADAAERRMLRHLRGYREQVALLHRPTARRADTDY